MRTYWINDNARSRAIAAAIRRLKEGATPEPVPSLAKLFDDIAAKQRSINDQFEEFMSDVEGKP